MTSRWIEDMAYGETTGRTVWTAGGMVGKQTRDIGKLHRPPAVPPPVPHVSAPPPMPPQAMPPPATRPRAAPVPCRPPLSVRLVDTARTVFIGLFFTCYVLMVIAAIATA